MPDHRALLLALFALLIGGCIDPYIGDDDDVSDDDDDSAADDDDSVVDDDDTSADDDDDSTPACPPTVQAALQDMGSWTRVLSCGRAYLSIGPADESFRLRIRWELNGLPLAAGQSWIYSPYDITPNNVVPGSLSFQEGQSLMAYDCTDVVEQEPIIARAWSATEGTALLMIDSYFDEWSWSATAQISGVIVQVDGDPSTVCALPEMSWSGLGMGWQPG